MKPVAKNLRDVFSILKPDMSVDCIDVCPELYPMLERNYSGFKDHALVAVHEFTNSWGSWEQHPAGDEIVVLLSGSAKMILLVESIEESIELNEPGSYVVVPSGVWHTARISKPTKMLFITPGEGTQHVDSPNDLSE